MSQVIQRYFTASKEYTKALFQEWQATQVEVEKLKTELLAKYKADALYMRGRNATALCIVIGADDTPAEMRGMSVHKMSDDEKWYAIYSPNKRFKEGKTLAADLKAYNRAFFQAPDFSDFAVNKLNCHREIIGYDATSRTRTSLYISAAGTAKGLLALIIPTGGQDTDTLPALHPELIEIKHSEFIALTKE